MNTTRPTLLIVDDEPINIEIIVEHLESADYRLLSASNGEQAWAMLQDPANAIDCVLLDRMMPGIDGIEVLRRIKQHPDLRLLPVIMQTAASEPEQVAEGLREGAFYYLIKPFAAQVLHAIIATALRDRADQLDLQRTDASRQHFLQMLDAAAFRFRTTDEAREIAAGLAQACTASPQTASLGLMELMLNAIEHGNLGITYDEKTALINENRLREEVQRRLTLPDYCDRVASISFHREGENTVFTITDQGKGFDWKTYLEMSTERLMDNHGRGIAMSRSISFSRLEYHGNGNKVVATIGPDRK